MKSLFYLMIFLPLSVFAQVSDRSTSDSVQRSFDTYPVITQELEALVSSGDRALVHRYLTEDFTLGVNFCGSDVAQRSQDLAIACMGAISYWATKPIIAYGAVRVDNMTLFTGLVRYGAAAAQIYENVSNSISDRPVDSFKNAKKRARSALLRFSRTEYSGVKAQKTQRFRRMRRDVSGSQPTPIAGKVDNYVLNTGYNGTKILLRGVVEFDPAAGIVAGQRFSVSLDSSTGRKAQEATNTSKSDSLKSGPSESERRAAELVGG